MNVANPVLHWAPELRRLAAGATIAAYLLVPPMAPAITRVQARPNGDAPWLITSIPDGYFDLRMARFRTREGLGAAGLLVDEPQGEVEQDPSLLPTRLREVSGLPVATLAGLVGVSKVTYHNWLKGDGISDENASRLAELLTTLRSLRDLRGADLPAFLGSTSPVGRVADLLLRGDTELVMGLALRPAMIEASASAVADEVWAASGLTGWLQPVARLDWGGPQLKDDELEGVLMGIDRRPLAGEDVAIDDGDEPLFVAHVQFAS